MNDVTGSDCKKLLLEILLMFCAKMMVRRYIACAKQDITTI